MNLKEQYEKETGNALDIEVCYFSVTYYSEEYINWLESKIKDLIN